MALDASTKPPHARERPPPNAEMLNGYIKFGRLAGERGADNNRGQVGWRGRVPQ